MRPGIVYIVLYSLVRGRGIVIRVGRGSAPTPNTDPPPPAVASKVLDVRGVINRGPGRSEVREERSYLTGLRRVFDRDIAYCV